MDYRVDGVGYYGDADCVSCAQTVKDKYGGDIYKLPLDFDPYLEDGEPRLTDHHGQVIDSHYWAMVGNHLVDLHNGNQLDLDQPEHKELAERIYGPVDSWVKVSEQELMAHFMDVPDTAD